MLISNVQQNKFYVRLGMHLYSNKKRVNSLDPEDIRSGVHIWIKGIQDHGC